MFYFQPQPARIRKRGREASFSETNRLFVEHRGVEPLTSTLRTLRSTN